MVCIASFLVAIAVPCFPISPALSSTRPPSSSLALLPLTPGDLAQARQVFERATAVPFKHVDDLASVWCEWAEMELRNKYVFPQPHHHAHHVPPSPSLTFAFETLALCPILPSRHRQYKKALYRLQTATTIPPRTAAHADLKEHELPAQLRVHRSLKLWSLYADLEESLGTFETARAVYTRMLELRVATPQLVINFAAFLEEKNFFEDAFAVDHPLPICPTLPLLFTPSLHSPPLFSSGPTVFRAHGRRTSGVLRYSNGLSSSSSGTSISPSSSTAT